MKYISLSFDDSKKNFYDNAFPLLKKYRIPATLNAITARVNAASEKADRKSMNVAEIQSLDVSGLIEIASHSAHHKNDKHDVKESICDITSWKLIHYGGGYASPFSKITAEDIDYGQVWDLVESGELKYVRSGSSIRREGLFYALISFINRYVQSSRLYWLLNRKFIIGNLSRPLLPSVAIHCDTTVKQLLYLVGRMKDEEAVVFCLHNIENPGSPDYKSLYSWDCKCLEEFIRILSTDETVMFCKTETIVDRYLKK